MASADIERQAIGKAASAFAQLHGGNELFQECIDNAANISQLVEFIEDRLKNRKSKSSFKLLAFLQKHTAWLSNISGVIDVAVQTQAELLCPIWAPIRFLLLASNFHAQVAEQITTIIETISESLPRLELYKKLQSDKGLQLALLDIFTDIVEFCVASYRYFKRGTLVRIRKLIVTPLKAEFQEICDRLKRHTKNVDDTAVAVELLRAAEFRNKMQAENEENMRSRCDMWLKPANMPEVHQSRSQMRMAGTCEWLLSHDTYKGWITRQGSAPEDRLFCILGKGGCGKSILSSYILDKRREGDDPTLYFSFSGADASRQTLRDLARSLISQLLRSSEYSAGYGFIREFMAKGESTVVELWCLLYNIINLDARPLMLVIDGVDECIGPVETLLEHLTSMLKSIQRLKIILLGRAHLSELKTHTRNVIEIDTSLVEFDIRSYIAAKVESNSRFRAFGVQDIVSQKLLERSDGMFLWVKLTMDDLSRASSIVEVTQKLEYLPRGLHATYNQIAVHLIQTLDEFEISLAQRILGFVMVAGRTLNVEELHWAHALSSRATASDYRQGSIQDHLFINPEEKISRVCGGFIHIIDGKINLVHITAKEFLQRWANGNIPNTLGFKVDLVQAHELFSIACLDYICLDGLGISNSNGSTNLMAKNLQLFFRYAAKYCVYHFKNSGEINEQRVERIKHLIQSGGIISCYEHFFLYSIEEGDDKNLDQELSNFFKWAEMHHLNVWPKRSLLSIGKQEVIQRFGAEDWRARQFWAITMHQIPSAHKCEEPTKVDDVERIESKTAPDHVTAIKTLLNGNHQLSTRSKVDLLLNMVVLVNTKALTDPLEALFLLIMQRAQKLPAVFLMVIGTYYLRFKRPRQAVAAFKAALNNLQHLETPLKFSILEMLGDIYYFELLEDKEAETAYRKSAMGRQEIFGPDHEKTLCSLEGLAQALSAQQDYASSEDVWSKVYEARLKHLAEDSLAKISSLPWQKGHRPTVSRIARPLQIYSSNYAA